MEVVVTTGTIRHVKPQSDHYHQQQDITELSTGQMPFLSPNRCRQSTEWKMSGGNVLQIFIILTISH